jgi:hypothetical protein
MKEVLLKKGLSESMKEKGSNLVDPASSHMLVLKTKPCMSKYKYYTAKLRMAH